MRRRSLLPDPVRTAMVLALALAPHAGNAQAKRAPTPSREPAPEVRRLTITGVTRVDVADLEQSIATQPTSCISILLAPICAFSHSPPRRVRAAITGSRTSTC